jgi:hypothetical protein
MDASIGKDRIKTRRTRSLLLSIGVLAGGWASTDSVLAHTTLGQVHIPSIVGRSSPAPPWSVNRHTAVTSRPMDSVAPVFLGLRWLILVWSQVLLELMRHIGRCALGQVQRDLEPSTSLPTCAVHAASRPTTGVWWSDFSG